MKQILVRLRDGLAFLLIVGGGAGIVASTLAPWAATTVFKNINVNVPGVLFASGALCLTVGVLTLLGMRRLPTLCLIGAVLTLAWVRDGRREIPMRVKHQMIGAQMALFPLNRILDQAHIPQIDVGVFGVQDDQLLGPGLDWTEKFAEVMLLGSLSGVAGDPVVVWIYQRTARSRCKFCGARWLASRHALFCPECGETTLPKNQRLCPVCHTIARPRDLHCIACGTTLPEKSTGTRLSV